MANGNSKVVVTEFSITFGGTTYDAKSIAPGQAQTAEPTDVTVGSDVEQRFDCAGITKKDPIEATIAGTPPEANSVASLTLKMKTETAGAAATSADVVVGNCIVTDVKPSTIEAGGDRAQWWDVTFTPQG